MKKENPENVKRRNREYYKRMKDKGFWALKVWIPKDKSEEIKKLINDYLAQ